MKPVFPAISEEVRLSMLALPEGQVDAVLDTDTYNEIDDQFAVVYALLSPERIRLRAIYAAPFYNEKSHGPRDGMEKSYEEIGRILSRMGASSEGLAFRGSEGYLPGEETPVESAAARDLVEKARGYTSERPLYVIAIGAITNVASAILMAPDIIDKIVVVWLGGHALHWKDTREFNLIQDVPAARVVFGCGVPVVQLPCAGVVDRLTLSMSEIEDYVRGRGAIGDFLAENVAACFEDPKGRSRVIWDISTIAWLVCPEGVRTQLRHSPIVSAEGLYSVDHSRHLIRSAYWIDRDRIFVDFFDRLEKFTEGRQND